VSASPPASRLLGQLLRRGAPGLTRAVVTTLLDPQRRRAVAAALARFEQERSLGPVRHPMAPAAVRVERSRSRGRRGEEADQVAVTMWFGEGPALPSPGGRLGRGAVRIGAGVVSAATVAAVGALAARMSERPALSARESRPLLVDPAKPNALGPGRPAAH
jgi:hypothetical protein